MILLIAVIPCCKSRIQTKKTLSSEVSRIFETAVNTHQNAKPADTELFQKLAESLNLKPADIEQTEGGTTLSGSWAEYRVVSSDGSFLIKFSGDLVKGNSKKSMDSDVHVFIVDSATVEFADQKPLVYHFK